MRIIHFPVKVHVKIIQSEPETFDTQSLKVLTQHMTHCWDLSDLGQIAELFAVTILMI